MSNTDFSPLYSLAPAFQADDGGSIPLTRSSLLIGLAIAPCIMHDIAAAGLYGPPHPL
jgi:hypothetical protein